MKMKILSIIALLAVPALAQEQRALGAPAGGITLDEEGRVLAQSNEARIDCDNQEHSLLICDMLSAFSVFEVESQDCEDPAKTQEVCEIFKFNIEVHQLAVLDYLSGSNGEGRAQEPLPEGTAESAGALSREELNDILRGINKPENWTFEGEPITEEALQQMREYGLNIAFLDIHDCSGVIGDAKASGNQDDASLCLDAQEFLLATNEKFACLPAAADLSLSDYPGLASALYPDWKKNQTDACIENLQDRLNNFVQDSAGDLLSRKYSAFFNMAEVEQMAEENLNRMRVYRNYLMMKPERKRICALGGCDFCVLYPSWCS